MSGNKKTLIIVIRGWSNTRRFFGRVSRGGEIPPEMLQEIAKTLPQVEVWSPSLNLAMFCLERPEDVVTNLFNSIDSYLSQRDDVESIVIVGYSAGSLLARSVFCRAHGTDSYGNTTQPIAPWANQIQRLVFLAGITRGWEFSSASPAHIRYFFPFIAGFLQFVSYFKSLSSPSRRRVPFILQLKRGSSFVVTTRIQYLNVIQSLRNKLTSSSDEASLTSNGLPSTIFLLGTQDEYMSPADCTELGPRSEFLYVELPGSNHAQALDISDGAPESLIRRDRLITALSEPFEVLACNDWVLPPEDINDYLDPMDLVRDVPPLKTEQDVEHVVLIIHGIRDNGFWTKRVAKELKTSARELNINLRAPTPSYGYFSMWNFVRPGGKDQATRWFMERYADVKSHFPNARISFVGHSNGTYIAGKALIICPAIRFHRVVLTGSVLRCNYEWDKVSDRIDQVLNYVGSADFVVAFLPAVFEKLGLGFMDVGGAGAFGFDMAKSSQKNQLSCSLNEIEFIKGAHGAAIREDSWPDIAKFVITGEIEQTETVRRKWWLAQLYSFAPVLTLLLSFLAAMLLVAPVVAVVITPMEQEFTRSTLLWTVFAGLIVSWAANRFLRAW